jgi:hypothetical protein
MKEFQALKVYPSEQGLHIEFVSEAEAKAFYEQGKSTGSRVAIDGVTVTVLSSKSQAKN